MVDLLQFYRPRPRADYVHLLEKDITAFRSVAADASPQAAPTLSAAAGSMMSELLGALDD